MLLHLPLTIIHVLLTLHRWHRIPFPFVFAIVGAEELDHLLPVVKHIDHTYQTDSFRYWLVSIRSQLFSSLMLLSPTTFERLQFHQLICHLLARLLLVVVPLVASVENGMEVATAEHGLEVVLHRGLHLSTLHCFLYMMNIPDLDLG